MFQDVNGPTETPPTRVVNTALTASVEGTSATAPSKALQTKPAPGVGSRSVLRGVPVTFEGSPESPDRLPRTPLPLPSPRRAARTKRLDALLELASAPSIPVLRILPRSP